MLRGNGGDDILHGDDGNDILFSGNGRDQMYGGDGDDYLVSKRGGDTVYGGKGCDVFEVLSTVLGVTTFMDLEECDTLLIELPSICPQPDHTLLIGADTIFAETTDSNPFTIEVKPEKTKICSSLRRCFEIDICGN